MFFFLSCSTNQKILSIARKKGKKRGINSINYYRRERERDKELWNLKNKQINKQTSKQTMVLLVVSCFNYTVLWMNMNQQLEVSMINPKTVFSLLVCKT